MKIKKEKNIPTYPIKYFLEIIGKNLYGMKELSLLLDGNTADTKFLPSNDATKLDINEKVDLIVTSPPYANAQEYFRNIKLELFWLKLANREDISKLDRQQIGGENHAYKNLDQLHLTKIAVVDKVIKKIYNKDRKKAYVVYKYFYNMDKNIFECSRVLKEDKHFVIIVGNNYVKGYEVPLHRGLIEIAKNHGFKLHDLGFDIIKNRKFMTKRNNNATPIDKDWVIDLIKS